jgi:hypothetical protein
MKLIFNFGLQSSIVMWHIWYVDSNLPPERLPKDFFESIELALETLGLQKPINTTILYKYKNIFASNSKILK